jgi:hypothetical protein
VTKPKAPDRKDHALRKKHHNASTREFVDIDYAHKLSPEERAWMSDFLDGHYNARFRTEGTRDWSDEEKREAYRRKNDRNKDALTAAQNRDGVDALEDHPDLTPDAPPDWSDSPAYLDSPEYKAARERVRSLLHPHNRPLCPPPQNLPALEKAQADLKEIVNAPAPEAADPDPE